MNKKDFKNLLQELGDQLGKSIIEIKQELSQARSLYTRIKAYVDNSNTLVDKITNKDTGLEKILINAQTLESQISTLKTNAETHLESITKNLNSIQVHITEMETAYSKFTEINDKITNKDTGLEAILSDSESLKSDIEATKKTSETIFKEISKLKDTASGYVTDLRKLTESAKQTVEMITKNHRESEDLKTKINNIFNISSQKAHANYFDARQKTLAKTSVAWLIGFLAMLLLTVYLGDKYIYPFIKIIGNGANEIVKTVTIEALLIRLGLVTPAILASIYCLKQFGNERRLHEQYAFKAVSMLSIESSVELLMRSLAKNDKAEDKDNRIVTFAVKTLESIYKDPIDTARHSLIFKGGNKLLELSAEINESVGEIKSDLDQIKDVTLKDKK